MISNEHRKHSRLARPALGRFARQEWAFVGAPCEVIEGLVWSLIAALSPYYRCAYVDADHAADEPEVTFSELLAAGATLTYTDGLDSRRLHFEAKPGVHQLRQLFNEIDLALVNGNHHEAAAQVVIIDPRKEASLRKRLAQLTNVGLVLLAEGVEQPYEFLSDCLPADVPRLPLDDQTALIHFFEAEMLRCTPPVNGLVLAGGRSLRMGRDKGAIAWHGKPQREYAADLLADGCAEVFISCRPDQVFESAYPLLPDTFADLGPYGAILSAFRQQPDRAWLVVACDLPLIDRATLDFLLQHRAPRHLATTFRSPHDELPEPLITIWEPKSYAVLLSFLSQGYSCPRKVLLQSDTHLLTPPDATVLTNVNTAEEELQVKPLIH